MKNLSLAMLAFLLWAAFALLFHQYASNSICGDCATSHDKNKSEQSQINQKTKIDEIVEEISEPTFSIMSTNDLSIFNFPKPFSINSKNGEVFVPSESINFKDSVYNYLNVNQDKELLVTAKFLASENNANSEIQFGNDRTQFLKDILVKAGVNPDKIVLKTIPSEFNYDENGNYYDGISMMFQNVSNNRSLKIEEGIANKTLYSDFAIKEFKPDRKLKAYTIELKNYLAKYPNKKIYVEGHTDSIGNDNYEFGLDRANNVKNYLISQGISPAIIKVSSKGETEPVASNNTEEGKAKNRRIEITIK